jgi:hypothetical protein
VIGDENVLTICIRSLTNMKIEQCVLARLVEKTQHLRQQEDEVLGIRPYAPNVQKN